MNRLKLDNKRFGKLIVQSYHDSINGDSYWICKCDCGNIKYARGSSLVNGDTKSCGCLLKENAKLMSKNNIDKPSNRKLEQGISGRNLVYQKYVYGATKRHIDFSLTVDEATTLFKGNCFYCGAKPALVEKSKTDRRDGFLYNGIDRVDNSKGYTLDNCVSCCKRCNRNKNSVTLDMARKIVEFCDRKAN